MLINIELDDALAAEAFKCSTAVTKRDLVHQALSEFVASHIRKNMLELVGKVKITDEYDHISLRNQF